MVSSDEGVLRKTKMPFSFLRELLGQATNVNRKIQAVAKRFQSIELPEIAI